MPFLLANVIRHRLAEFDHYLCLSSSGMNAKTVSQLILDRKFGVSFEGLAGLLHVLDPRGHKCSNVFAQMIVCEEKPLPIHIGQMIGINQPRFGRLLPRFSIAQSDLLAPRCGLSEL